MPQAETDYLTTKELAELLRIKERKVYDLAASGEVPCSRVLGKLLFPRREVETWLTAGASGGIAPRRGQRPSLLLGSHEPVLEWALRESRCGLATFLDGSLDGLDRFARGEGLATGLHLYAPEADAWNLPIVQQRFATDPVVLVEWAWRDRGLIVAPGEEARIAGFSDLRGRRVVPRQPEAGTQRLFEHLLSREGVALSELDLTAPSRSETDAALAVVERRADTTFGLLALARQYRLGFVPIIRECFDLLVDRRSWFEPPMQALLAFCRSETFATRTRGMEGYDLTGLGRVHFNGR